MAIIKARDAAKMSQQEISDKMKELRAGLVRANVAANKATAKTKEIKKAVARLITFSKSQTKSAEAEGVKNN